MYYEGLKIYKVMVIVYNIDNLVHHSKTVFFESLALSYTLWKKNSMYEKVFIPS